MRKWAVSLLAAVFVFSIGTAAALAEDWEKHSESVPTKVLVRVLSHGAKAMSQKTGALVVFRDARTGKELDKGAVQGSTGDTKALMEAGYQRMESPTGLIKGDKGFMPDGRPYESMDEAAKYIATLYLDRPTQLLIEVYGPLMPQHSMGSTITNTWVFPGEDVLGQGIVVDLRGLIIDARDSLRGADIKADDVKSGIQVPFFMRMMCGCPIAPKSMGLQWRAEDFKITVQAYYKGKLYHEEVTTSDKLFVDVSSFIAKVPLPKDLPAGPVSKERLKIRLMAAQPTQANYGLDEFDVYLNR
ncbi:MAG: hypothetical protein HZC51_03795 [Nitrospirae bacterium]|nr:hypothetical protein [Nitrospirota bacterium]